MYRAFKFIISFASLFFLFTLGMDYYSTFTTLHLIVFYAIIALVGASFWLSYYPDNKYTLPILGVGLFGSIVMWIYFSRMYSVGMVSIGGGIIGLLQKDSDKKHKKVKDKDDQADTHLRELAQEVNKQAKHIQALERKKQVIDMNIGKQNLSTDERIQRDILVSKPVEHMTDQEVEDFLSLVLADNGHYDPQQSDRIMQKLRQIDKQIEELS
jgi:hypothetical protein